MNDTRKPVYVDRRPPPANDNSGRLLGLGAVTFVVIGIMAALFWVLAANDSGRAPRELTASPAPSATPAEPAPAPTPTPTPTQVEVPPAPAKNELSSNEWLLSPYAIVQENGNLVVTGTVQNLAAPARSATMRVFVYVDGNPVATAVGEVRDVQGGGSLEVSLPSDTAWTAGNKVLLVSAVDLP